MPISLVIAGIKGRMGSLIAELARADERFTVAGGTDVIAGPGVVTSLEALLPGAEVVVDFTSHAASVVHARACAAAGVPIVIGATGLDAEEHDALVVASRTTAVLAAPNMSVGVNVFLEVAAQLAARLGAGYDVEIVETHHRMKKDAPSGTAVRLAEVLAGTLRFPPEAIRSSRVGMVGERPRQELGVHAVRGGDVVGEHTVFFFGDGERVELTHRATSRVHFAAGALRAAAWLVGKAPGLYSMADVLAP